ncbi:TPA: hypothetical protein H1Q11_004520 [Salmonella enterica]|nr:hypothetical protein [Salmonella enterica]
MSKYSYLHELYLAYTDEQDARLQRYMQNVRAACVRSGGYARYKKDSEKYFSNRSKAWRSKVRRVFRHLNDDLWPAGLIYTVVNGKITGVRGSESGE